MPINPLCGCPIENSFPTQFDEEALTALQLTARTAGKMNEVIRGFNELEESVPGIVTQDVQRHIDSGAFDKQIDKNMGNLGAKVDNLLGSVKEGSTTLDAEVIDLRMDDNGFTYVNAGEAVRSQVGYGAGAAKALVMFPGNGYMKLDSYDTETGNTRIVMGGSSMYIIDPYNGKRYTLTKSQMVEQLPGYFITTPAPVIGQEGDLILTLPPYQGYLGVKLGKSPQLVLEYGEGDHHFKVPHDTAVLLYFYYGQVDGPAMWSGTGKSLGRYATEEELAVLDDIQKGSVYLSAGATVTFTKYGTNGGMAVDVHGLLRVRFPSWSKKYTDWASITGNLDPSKVQADGNHLSVILDRYDYYLVYDVATQDLRIRTAALNLHATDFVLAQVGYEEMVGGALLDIHTRTAANRVHDSRFPIDQDKVGAFLEHYHSLKNKSAFIFFTDPHLCMGSGQTWEKTADIWLNTILQYHAMLPTAALVCGGDWLGNSDTPAQAMYKAHWVKGKMGSGYDASRMFLNAVGNHDTNEQGRKTPASANWTGKFDNATTNKLWGPAMCDPATGTVISNPYSLGSCQLLILNSLGENSVGSDYAQQLSMLQDKLDYNGTPNSNTNYIVVCHMFYKDDNLTVGNFGSTVHQICDFYNTYNQGNGRVKAIFTGHRHMDHWDTLGEVPVVMTTHFQDGGTPTFDIVLVDGDTDAIHLYRIGSGSDRTIYMP